MTANDRIKILRKQLGLSQPKFGEKLGVGRDVIANLELNRVELKDMMLNLICKTFNVNSLWLEEGEGEMFIATPDSLVEDLATEFELTTMETEIISNFVNLPAQERQQLIELAKKLLNNS